MSLLNLFKLEKLRIEGYSDVIRKTPVAQESIEVLFNPDTYKRKHSIAYAAPSRQGINTSGRPARYTYTPPGEIDFKFIVDGTGVTYLGAVHLARVLGGISVKSEIADFETLCMKMNEDIHEPNFLKICWGDLTLYTRLKTLEITYTLFDESGDPLHAELAVTFVEDQSAESIRLRENKKSADLTHVRVVKSGDTLPLLCKEIYGSSAYYLRVAADNGLEEFRSLKPGQKLRFAPLARGDGPGKR